MKKLFLLLAVAVLGLTACKKDHVCTCTEDYDGVEVKYETTMNSKKGVAKAFCLEEGYEIVDTKVYVDGEEITDDDDDDDDDNNCTLD